MNQLAQQYALLIPVLIAIEFLRQPAVRVKICTPQDIYLFINLAILLAPT